MIGKTKLNLTVKTQWIGLLLFMLMFHLPYTVGLAMCAEGKLRAKNDHTFQDQLPLLVMISAPLMSGLYVMMCLKNRPLTRENQPELFEV